MNRLDGKVAIVFGAGPNIGGTIAHFLAREGARVMVSDVSEAAAKETVGFLSSRGYRGARLRRQCVSGARCRADRCGDRAAVRPARCRREHGRQSALVDDHRHGAAGLDRGRLELPDSRHADDKACGAGDDRRRREGQHHPPAVDSRAFRRGIRCGLHGGEGGADEPRPIGGDGPRA